MTAPREPHRPPAPPDRRPPRRGGSPSSKTASAAKRPAGFARLAGAALLALVGVLALPATAQAQTSCSLNTGDIWCGLVTVAEFERDSTSGTLRGYYTEIGGNLRPDEFTDFTDGTSYSVSGIYYVTEAVTGSFAAGTLVLEGNPKIPNGLTFQLGGAEFSTTSATIIGSRLTWSSSGLNWSVGDVVTAKLTRATPVASSDATLSGLTVTGGGSELVTFVSGTTTYTAMVANAVAEVTVTPMTTDTGATIAYLDGSDMTLTDAGTADGHQVALVEGDNVIKVKVTAADGNTTQTYTVTVTRAAAGGAAAGSRLEAELGYGMPVGGRWVGMPRFGIGTSGLGRDYRLGYGLTVAEGGTTHFDLGVYANRRESPAQGTAEHGVLGRLTARW